MYDFWFTLGTAVIHPEILDAIDAAAPVFNPVTSRTINEQDDKGGSTFHFENSKNAGLLDPVATDRVRTAIRRFVQENPASPPISFHTAAQFCRLAKIRIFTAKFPDGKPPGIAFRDLIQDAHQAYLEAMGDYTGVLAERFPALLGLCLIDERIVAMIRSTATPPVPPMVSGLLGEFGVKANPGTEVRTLQGFVGHPKFQSLIAADSDLWGGPCTVQMVSWGQNSVRALLP